MSDVFIFPCLAFFYFKVKGHSPLPPSHFQVPSPSLVQVRAQLHTTVSTLALYVRHALGEGKSGGKSGGKVVGGGVTLQLYT